MLVFNKTIIGIIHNPDDGKKYACAFKETKSMRNTAEYKQFRVDFIDEFGFIADELVMARVKCLQKRYCTKMVYTDRHFTWTGEKDMPIMFNLKELKRDTVGRRLNKAADKTKLVG